MAGTYFGYAERSVESQINWAEVGKNMSDMLAEEVRLREEKKAQIDEASRLFGETLTNAPTGDYDAGNTFTITYANDASEMRLMQDRLLKSGQLKVKDYLIARQNITSGTTMLFDLAREYQTEYANKMARWQGDEASFREAWEMEQAEGLSNLRNARALINPTNGVVSLGIWDDVTKAGMVDPSKYVTVAELRNRLKQTYDKYDLKSAVDGAVESLGEIQTAVLETAGAGGINKIITTVDAKTGDYSLAQEQFVTDYKQWEADNISQIMSNENHVQSILTDYRGSVTREHLKSLGLSQAEVDQAMKSPRITFTYDKAEFDADKTDRLIYLDRSTNAAGVPVFKESQRGLVEQYVRTAIRAGIDEKITVTSAGATPYAPQTRTTTTRTTDELRAGFEDVYKFRETSKFDPTAVDVTDDALSAGYFNTFIQSVEGGLVSGMSARPFRRGQGNGVVIQDEDNNTLFELDFDAMNGMDAAQKLNQINAIRDRIINYLYATSGMVMDAAKQKQYTLSYQDDYLNTTSGTTGTGATGTGATGTGATGGVTLPRPPQQQ